MTRKISWQAQCTRPDLSFKALEMTKKSKFTPFLYIGDDMTISQWAFKNIGFWHGKASQNKILRPEGEEFFLLARKLEKKLSPQAK